MTTGDPWQTVTLKLWYGGFFNLNDLGLLYMGSRTNRTVGVDKDDFSWFTLLEEAAKCGTFSKDVDAIYFSNPNFGLQKVVDDTQTTKIMCEIGVVDRIVECYLVREGDVAGLMQLIDGGEKNIIHMPQKLTPKRNTTQVTKMGECRISEENTDLVEFSDDDDDCQDECLSNEEEVVQGVTVDEISDNDEARQAIETLSEWSSNALKVAQQLQIEASCRVLDTNCSGGLQSDYDESGDEIHTPCESDDEETRPGKRRRSSVPVITTDARDFSKMEWCVGIRFPSREVFRDCVTRYAITQGRNVTFDVSDKERGKRLRVRCVAGCPFKLYASWDNKRASFVVKSVEPDHTCSRTMDSNRQLKSTWLAKQFLEVFKARPHWPASEIIETVRRAYKVVIKREFAYKIKYYAHKMLYESMKDHYRKTWSYIAALEQASPNSSYTMVTIPNPKSGVLIFQRFFVCFEALKQGWLLGCKKILSVDACFLKTFLGGQLISAVGRDANEQMFPLAWAVVEGENDESYEWFFQELKKSIGEVDGEGWTFISNQHQSILTTVAKEFPKAEHRHCARHIFANWHKSYKGDEMKMMFWNCAEAYNEADFNDALDALKGVDQRAAEAFLACKPKLFCKAFIGTTTQNDVIVNNMAESFNAYFINARAKHLIYMLEDIRVALMQRLVKKKIEMEKKSSVVCPRVQDKLEKEKERAAFCQVLPSSTTLFQVKHGIDDLIVDLHARTCTCRKWDLTGIPCFHVVAAVLYVHGNPEDYVSDYYKKETYLRVYSSSIPPIPGERHWPRIDQPLNPPPIKVGPGIPWKIRREPFEDPKRRGRLTKHGVEMTCSVCKSKTHNKRKCPHKDRVLERPPKRSRGRPRSTKTLEQTGSNTETHHHATAEPTRSEVGGASGGTITPSQGFDVLFDDQGNVVPRMRQNMVSIDERPTNQPSTQTQASTNPT